MTPLQSLFESLRGQNRKALMPFLTTGDPNIDTTEAVIAAARQAGADLCEVGVPYSDPIADGPVIQASYQRALDAGFKLQHVWDLGQRLTENPKVKAMPRVTMVSYSIIYRIGMAKYVDQAMQAGYCGAIVPDLLVEEAEDLSKICREKGFDLIQLVTPTTTRDRQCRIAELSSGFLYYVSVTGITGERTALPTNLVDNVGWLREQTELPICIGFGISGPETAAQLAPVSDGLIVGSAIVRRVADAVEKAKSSGADPVKTAAEEAGDFCHSLRQAIDAA
ncbi:MAG TPA: tryptophan synthase subunit alpha [Rhodopirellula baltica]|uniref:Tryptophan synthase alpha chain n=1 Tax=Rhodopirellula baltica (strain DSM 10527 / NCIMB 13988 / SH1) TaxID=243090 RepID=TRPA_RHOBA|nr:tryptophan synthase subunit alpha [Rhodopirellula baltica]Q7URN0.2 RecName: Full=Tryptophan synthase alpha chain [Rhodopirellula baltica SH 1]HBE61260.1 tryptophan synthase subunit alpha [Rhodopirellula baltica]